MKDAWKRLSEHFHRFNLCPENQFGIDILAPTLSKYPIYIRPVSYTKSAYFEGKNQTLVGTEEDEDEEGEEDEKQEWDDMMMDHNNSDCQSIGSKSKKRPASRQIDPKEENEKLTLLEAVKKYLNCDGVRIENVARSVQVIRSGNETRSNTNGTDCRSSARMIVDFVVGVDSLDQKPESLEQECPNINMVRVVNGVPILDSTEAHACGLVHGLVKCKAVWSSFGLQVSKSSLYETSSDCSLSFDLRDTAQVLPFIKWDNHQHRQLDDEDEEEEEEADEGEHGLMGRRKRGRQQSTPNLLPAHVRFGRVLIVVRIIATPSALPLPTLSKGRLPMNDRSLDTALQLGVEGCLKSLQQTNPNILLSPSQLRSIERDSRYVPAVASAIARMLCQSTNASFRSKAIGLVRSTRTAKPKAKKSNSQIISACDDESEQTPESILTYEEEDLSRIFEERLRLTIQQHRQPAPKSFVTKKRKIQGGEHSTEESYDDVIEEDVSEAQSNISLGIKSWSYNHDRFVNSNCDRSGPSTPSSASSKRSHENYRSIASSSSSSSMASTISSHEENIGLLKAPPSFFQNNPLQPSDSRVDAVDIKEVVIPVEKMDETGDHPHSSKSSIDKNEEEDFEDEWL